MATPGESSGERWAYRWSPLIAGCSCWASPAWAAKTRTYWRISPASSRARPRAGGSVACHGFRGHVCNGWPGLAHWPALPAHGGPPCCRAHRRRGQVCSAATWRPRQTEDGPAATDRRTGPYLDPRTERPLVVHQRLPRRHGAAHAAVGGHRFPARRPAQRHQPVRRRQDRLDARRRADLGDPGLRAVPGLFTARRARHDDPRKQLRAVDRDRGRLHDDAAHFRPRGLHVGDQPGPAAVADPGVQRRAVVHGRTGGVSDEASFHQRRTASIPRRPRLRRRARHPLPQRGGREGHAAGEGTRCRRGDCRLHELHRRRELHEADPAAVAGIQLVVAPASQAGRLVLLAGRERARTAAEARGRGYPPARAVTGTRLCDDRRGRPHGYPRGVEPAAGRAAQLRGRRADHDLARRNPAARGFDRGRHRDFRAGAYPQQLGALVRHHDDGGGFARCPVREA